MHVKHIILEGFKSYKDRTDIGPFDPHFNAITGLNGSGKSNILDAICFVLGLSSLQVVRAGNLGELVYKGGTGGVSRASASIVFDNKDKAQGRCPIGYEKFDEIIVSRTVEATGGCKYYLNSITSTKKQITDLFESVQLNIQNPNFMIMQGKITKVIGMNPKQILAMIEETVGGTVYQGKRDKTAQEIQNKERCLQTVHTVIEDDIYPEWRRQRDARDRLNEFQTVEQAVTRYSRNYAILLYRELQERSKVCQKDLDAVLKKIAEDDQKLEDNKKQIEDQKKRQLQMRKENMDKFKDKIEKAEKSLNVEKKSYVTIEAKVNSAKMDVEDAKKKVAEAEKAKKQQEKEMADYKKKSANTVNEFEAVKAEIVHAQEKLDQAKEQENALKMGNIMDDEGNTCDARQELMRVEDEINKIQPDFQVGDQQYKENQQKLRGLEAELKKTPSDDQVEKDYNAKFQRVEQLKAEAIRQNINPDDSPHEIFLEINTNRQKIDALEREKYNIGRQYSYLTLEYNKRNVDSTKVHGLLCELLSFRDCETIEQWGGAMEVCAGGLMGHIVVDDDVVGKALIDPRQGCLSRRTNVHPLSTFKSAHNSRVTQQELDRRLGPGKAVPVIDLVQYDPAYKEIVQHFLGGKVVCDTLETAKKVAYQMSHYAVSKLGDVADPGGIMQGGHRRNLGQLMPICRKFKEISYELKQLYAETDDLQRRLHTAKQNEVFMRNLEVAKRDLHNAEETRKLTKHSMMKKEVDELKKLLQEESEKLKEWKQKLDHFEKERKTWKNKVDQLEHLRAKSKKDNEALISKCEKALEAAKKKYNAKEKHFGNIDVEIRSLEALIEDCQKDIETANKEVVDCEAVVARMMTEFNVALQKFKEKESFFEEAVAESSQWNAEFNEIEEQIQALNNNIHQIELAKMKRNNLKEKLEATVNNAVAEIKDLQQKHKSVNLATEDTHVDDSRKSMAEIIAILNKNKKRYDELRERIDPESAHLYEGTRTLLKDAEGKMKQVEENKKDLERCIKQLDEHKLTIVMDAYKKINEEFDKMMSTLLPESRARLVPVNWDDLSQGLNIHVNLGGAWKESLSELSGGQRSLVALALVLSLCMFNPAPFYILDEIDAALDLNHTQNIGVLIKKKFTGTQFICVSLKDGMYSNCNILFQVQFVNGKSEVKRCVRQSSRRHGEDEEEDIAMSQKNNKRLNRIVSGR